MIFDDDTINAVASENPDLPLAFVIACLLIGSLFWIFV